MKDIYSTSGSIYLEMTGTWHAEDSQWKANQIAEIFRRNMLTPKSIVEIGCGAGGILINLGYQFEKEEIPMVGYDIAADAIDIAKQQQKQNILFKKADFTKVENEFYDVALMIDVFEHVPDYISFIEKCNPKSLYKVFHIPLDIHVSSVLRGSMIEARKKVGHLHYFSKETAMATLEDTGLEIIDFFYTKASFRKTNVMKTRILNLFRTCVSIFSIDLSAKLFGGYSLIVLAK